jgi:phospholipid/cholesterol/gamma-HCH transport system ATP-binding protein
VIVLEDVHKAFGDTRVLEGLSCEIEDGETFSLIGRSGSGKSVLLKHIVGLLRPDAGRVLVDDDDLARLSPSEMRDVRRRFGMLFQHGALFDSMSVYHNLAFPLRMLEDLDPQEEATRVYECLDHVELGEEVAEKQPSELSGGQAKRVALARAIVRRPDYLFYDEPHSGLDPETATTIDELICDLADALGATSIVVTHHVDSVLRISDRIGFLEDGAFRFLGTPEEARASNDESLRRFLEANAYTV